MPAMRRHRYACFCLASPSRRVASPFAHLIKQKCPANNHLGVAQSPKQLRGAKKIIASARTESTRLCWGSSAWAFVAASYPANAGPSLRGTRQSERRQEGSPAERRSRFTTARPRSVHRNHDFSQISALSKRSGGSYQFAALHPVSFPVESNATSSSMW